MAEEKKRPYTRRGQDNQYVPIQPNETGKLPPQALELEESVLGAIMIEKDAYLVVADILRPESFYKDAHQKIFAAIVSLAMRQDPVDMHTVTEQLRKNGTIDDVGGPYYIALLTAKVTSSAHLEYHARIVAQKYMARELIRISTEIQTKAFDDRTDVADLMQDAEGMLFEVTQRSLKRDVTQIDPVIDDAIERIKDAFKNQGSSGVPTGFTGLDKITSGWQKSDLVIIAARPAMGKTAFVLSMAKNMAVDFNVPVAVFSLEMSNVQLVNRLMMNVCEIGSEKIKNGDLKEYEWQQLDYKLKDLYGAPIFVDDTPSLSVFELRSKARRLAREHNIQCIVIDYLQLMNASGMQFGSREQEVSLISRSLKGLAKELDIPVIALSQLNRGVEGRTGLEGKRPQLSDLRESGSIEQDADMVCFIHRPEYYGLTEDKEGNSLVGMAEIIIAKHRNGAVGDVRLRFKGQYTKFMNPDDEPLGDPFADNYKVIGSKMNDVANEQNFYTDSTPLSSPPPSSDMSGFSLGDNGDQPPF